jgi:hypothetical protein
VSDREETPSPEYLRNRAAALRRKLERSRDTSSSYARLLKAAIDDLEERAALLEARRASRNATGSVTPERKRELG